MKIRNGFVSNSSSSSFIVLFPFKIDNIDDLYGLMWTSKNKESIQSRWKFKVQERIQKSYEKFINESYNNVNMSFEEFLKKSTDIIFREIKEQGENNYMRALSLLCEESWLNDDGKLITMNGLEFDNIDDVKKSIQDYNKLQDSLEDFDWNIEDADDLYQELENNLYKLNEIENFKNKLIEIEDILDKHNEKIFYTFRFSDEDSTFFGIMEHGHIFGNLPVYVESFH